MSEYDVIEAKARLILKNYGFDYLIHPQTIPIEEIIESLGIIVDYAYLTKNGNRILGKFVCENGATICYDMEHHHYKLIEVEANTILVEARLHDEKKYGRIRFTLAHELAHWLLHRNLIMAMKDDAAYDGTSDAHIERQADFFAACILMPIGTVKKYFYSLKSKRFPDDLIVSDMANYFNVSEQAMRIKLESHNLIDEKVKEAHNELLF